MDKEFSLAIYSLAERVPPGRVTTYGQLAALAGRPRWARQAGHALSRAPAERPCHRVVNSQGRLVPGWARQRQLLQAEGVQFKENGCVDMRRHRLTAEEWMELLNR